MVIQTAPAELTREEAALWVAIQSTGWTVYPSLAEGEIMADHVGVPKSLIRAMLRSVAENRVKIAYLNSEVEREHGLFLEAKAESKGWESEAAYHKGRLSVVQADLEAKEIWRPR